MYRLHACASARFRDRCIVPIDVPCVMHLCVHVWVRHIRQGFTLDRNSLQNLYSSTFPNKDKVRVFTASLCALNMSHQPQPEI